MTPVLQGRYTFTLEWVLDHPGDTPGKAPIDFSCLIESNGRPGIDMAGISGSSRQIGAFPFFDDFQERLGFGIAWPELERLGEIGPRPREVRLV